MNRFAFKPAIFFITFLAVVIAGMVPAKANVFSISNTSDTSDMNPGDGVCGDALGSCSFRAAIEEANAFPGTDTIRFDVMNTGPQTIMISGSPLPSITDPLIIDGFSKPDASPPTASGPGTLMIEIRGISTLGHGLEFMSGSDGSVIQGISVTGFGYSGIMLESGSNQVLGCHIGVGLDGTTAGPNTESGITISFSSGNYIGSTNAADRNVISGNLSNGITLNSSATGNFIMGNYIGTDADGIAKVANGGAGVSMQSGTMNNVIGGNVSGAGNIISGNGGHGIEIQSGGGDYQIIQGNYIGVNKNGSALANSGSGVMINDSTGNIIGGSTAVERNVISGNSVDGVAVYGSPGPNTITGNYIGLDPTGTSAVPNGWNGVLIDISSLVNIGGSLPGEGNVISGNTQHGITIHGTSGSNKIIGNMIGTNASVTGTVGNQGSGIYIQGGSGNLIGGMASTEANVISGNADDGIRLTDATTGNDIDSNFIGTDLSGFLSAGNGQHGIRIDAGSKNNTIGGGAIGNVVTNNGLSGVYVSGATSNQNRIQQNSIFGNGSIGIDLVSGANNGIGTPVLSNNTGAQVTVTFTGLSGGSYHFEFFANSSSMSQNEGEVFFGFQDMNADVSGNVMFNYDYSSFIIPGKPVITATVTDISNLDTSEFSDPPPNEPPVNVLPATTPQVDEDNPLTMDGSNLVSILDPDVGLGNLLVDLTVTNGILTLNPLGTGGLTNLTGDGTETISMEGTLDAITISLAGMIFEPDPDFFGTANIHIHTDDQGNSGTGGPLFDADDLSIDVLPVPDFPVLNPIGDQNVDEGMNLTFTATATDADLPSDSLSFSIDAGAPTGASIDPISGVFSYTPAEDEGPGSYSVTVRVTDLSGNQDFETITITVNEINSAPVLDPIGPQTADVGTALTFTASATDQDLPANSLSYSLTSAPTGAVIDPATGLFNWTPDTDGTFSATVRVSDNGSPSLFDEETITITVSGTNTPPVLDPIGPQTVAEGSVLTFTATATDPDAGTVLTFSLIGGPPTAAIDPNSGVFLYVNTVAGTYTATIRVTDDGSPSMYDEETFDITVTGVNDPPVLDPIGPQSVNEGETLTFTASATDPDTDDILTFSLQGAPSGAVIDPVTGVFSWAATTPGTYSCIVRVTDSAVPPLSDEETITITVNNLNDPPVLDPIGPQAINEGGTLSFTATASDPDTGDTLHFFLVSGPMGAVIDPTTGVFTWPAGAVGTYSATVRVEDSGSPALYDEEIVTITVSNTNNPPVIDPVASRNVDEGSTLSVPVTATDPDTNDTLSFELVNPPTGATISSASGLFTWTPDTPGSYNVTVRVTDSGTPQMTDEEIISITVNDINFAPQLQPAGPFMAVEGESLSEVISATDPDTGDILAFSLVSGPSGATIDMASGVFSWIAGTEGTYEAVIRVTDNGTPNLSDEKTYVIVVTQQNHPPVIQEIPDIAVPVGVPVSFQVNATDVDDDHLTFFVVEGPNDAEINPGTGEFDWTPASAGASLIIIRVSDGEFFAEEGFNVTAVGDAGPPIVVTVNCVGNGLTTGDTADFIVAFSKDVEGVDITDFQLIQTVSNGEIMSVDGTGSEYTVTVGNFHGEGALLLQVLDDDSIHDAGGQPLGGPGPENGGFTDGLPCEIDTVPLTVLSVIPASGSTGVTVSTAVTVNFSERPDPDTLSSETFTVSGDNGPVEGDLSLSGTSASFVPKQPLESDTVYTATMGHQVSDLAGNPMNSDYSWNFTTAVEIPGSFTLTPGAEDHGSIEPEQPISVSAGGEAEFTFIPDPGFEVSGVFVDGQQVLEVGHRSYTFSNVSSGHTIYVMFYRLDADPPDKPQNTTPLPGTVIGNGYIDVETSGFNGSPGDIQSGTHFHARPGNRRYHCSDCPEHPSFDQLVQTGIDGDPNRHTFIGIEPGIKYSWNARHHGEFGGFSEWSDETEFIGGTLGPEVTLTIRPGSYNDEYQLLSLPYWFPATYFRDLLAGVFPDGLPGEDYRIGTFDPETGAYIEYGNGILLQPGATYWFLARYGFEFSVQGVPVAANHVLEIRLLHGASGWNLIAPPINSHFFWDDCVVVAYDPDGNITDEQRVYDLPDQNAYIDKRFWHWNAGKYSAYYPSGDRKNPDAWIRNGSGGWILVKMNDVFIRFTNEARPKEGETVPPLDGQKSGSAARSLRSESESSPPMPMGGLNEAETESGGGCFIRSLKH